MASATSDELYRSILAVHGIESSDATRQALPSERIGRPTTRLELAIVQGRAQSLYLSHRRAPVEIPRAELFGIVSRPQHLERCSHAPTASPQPL